MPRYTDEAILLAMKGTGGIIREIARKLGCKRQTISERLEKSKKLRKARISETKNNVDMGEMVLLKLMSELNLDATKYYLNAMGKDRGYGTQSIKQEIKQDIKQETTIKKIEIEIV